MDERPTGIRVAATAQEAGRRKENPTSQGFKIFVGSLDPLIDDAGLRKRFAEFGKLKHAVVIKQRQSDGTQASRGYGFVTFEEMTGMAEALSADTVYMSVQTPTGVVSKEVNVKPYTKKDQLAWSGDGGDEGQQQWEGQHS